MTRKNKSSGLFSRLVALPLIIWLVFIVSSYGFYEVFLAQQHQAYHLEQQRGALADLLDKVEGLEHESERYQTLAPVFAEPAVQGLMAQMNRVDWVDRVTIWTKQMLASGLSLQFSPEQSLANHKGQIGIDKNIVHLSQITLGIQLQTDTDFVDLMQFIRQEITPNVWIESCQLARLSQDLSIPIQFSAHSGNIQSLCVLNVYRAQPRYFQPSRWQ